MIKRVGRLLIESFAQQVGIPLGVKRVLLEYPGLRAEISEPPRVVSERSRLRWEEWAEQLTREYTVLRGQVWHPDRREAMTGSFSVPYLSDIVQCSVHEKWECDIRDVDGLYATRHMEQIETTDSLDNFALEYGNVLRHPQTKEVMESNLAANDKNSVEFARYAWDGRLFLMNHGGSHRFASARYIAGKLGLRVPLRGMLREYRLNTGAIATMRTKYHLFAITKDNDQGYNLLLEELRLSGATFYWHEMPAPCQKMDVLILPCAHDRSARIAAMLGGMRYFEVGEQLAGLASRQRGPLPGVRPENVRMECQADS